MANIFLNLPRQEQNSGCSFRVEWKDDVGRTRDRCFASYGEAERFALANETRLFNEALQDFIHMQQTLQHQAPSPTKRTVRRPASR
jgi:hypothetical protein